LCRQLAAPAANPYPFRRDTSDQTKNCRTGTLGARELILVFGK
jgi:hypothetical protein